MRVAFLNWRDLTHPSGGGAERYAQTICSGLAARGHDVTLLTADHGGAPGNESVDGYRILRQGGRYGVYGASLRRLRRLEAAEGRFDVVVDTQNGIPFFSRRATSTPVINLVHHVHREVWPVVCPPPVAITGWWIESRLAPRIYRGCQYVAVSGRTRDELIDLGVPLGDICVIHNGTDSPRHLGEPRSAEPTIVVLGRLVPHKRVELAIDAVGALLDRHPGLNLRIIGDGWWRQEVAAHAREAGLGDRVTLLGHVDEDTKHLELQRAWVALAPSTKEGWGLNVVEAGAHATPTVAHHGAGGLSESIIDGVTGLLAHDFPGLVAATDQLLTDQGLRQRLGAGAREHAARFTWDSTVTQWERLLEHTAGRGAPVGSTDLPLLPVVTAGVPRQRSWSTSPAEQRLKEHGANR